MISDERLEQIAKLEVEILTFPPNHAQTAEMAKELLALRKIQALPSELPCDVTIGATTFKAGVESIKLLKAIHRRAL